MIYKPAEDINSKLTWFCGFLIVFISVFLFILSDNSFISAFYILISGICGIFLMLFFKDIPVFSPIFMLFSSIFINIGFPSLYLFVNKISLGEELLKNASLVYIIYFLALISPLFFMNKIFKTSDKSGEGKTAFFCKNFKPEKINFYFTAVNIILLALILILLKITGFSYTEALKHPLEFRFAASAGSFAYIRKLIFFLFMINTFLLAKYNFSENLYKKNYVLKLKIFSALHIIFLILFALISGSRSIIFLPVISVIVIYSFYNRLKIKNIMVFSVIFLVTLSLISFYYVYRNNPSFPVNFKTVFTIKIFSENIKRLDNFKNSLYFFEYIEKENGTIFYFKDFNLLEQMKNHILQPFPRKLISDKGYYFSTSMTEKVFNQEINEGGITYNFGGISNAFWNFGIAGVILEGLFLGIAVVWLHKMFLRFINYDSFFLFFMTTFFFVPNSIIVDGFWNTMDGCGYFLNLVVLGIIFWFLSNKKIVFFEKNIVFKL